MNCPWCGEELKTGQLIIGGEHGAFSDVLWKSDDEKFGLIDRMCHTDGWPVNGLEESGLGRKRIAAYYCPACKKFILDGWVSKD